MDCCWKAGGTAEPASDPKLDQIVKEQPLAGRQLILEPSSPDRSWSSLELSPPPVQCPSPDSLPLSSPPSVSVYSPENDTEMGRATSWVPKSNGFAAETGCVTAIEGLPLRLSLLPSSLAEVVKLSEDPLTPSETLNQVHELGEPTHTASDIEGLANVSTRNVNSRHGSSPASELDKRAIGSTIRVSHPSARAQQAVLCASTAMSHLLRHEEELFRVFEQHGVARNLVLFMAGFDQINVMLGIGLLEEIFIVSQVEVTNTISCSRQLGEILSPFVGSVETPACSFRTPVIPVQGTECNPVEHKAKRTRRMSEAARDRITLLDTVSLSHPEDENGGSVAQGNSEGPGADSSARNASGARGSNDHNLPTITQPTSLTGEGGRENLRAGVEGKDQNVDDHSQTRLGGVAGDLPPEPPGSTKTGKPSSVFFECNGRMYPGSDISSSGASYTNSVQTSGSVTYEIVGDAASSHHSRVSFSYLELQGTRSRDDNIETKEYHITHSQVAVNSLQQRTRCIILQPETTSQGESSVKQTESRKTATTVTATGTGGISGLHPTGTLAVTPGRSMETTTSREQATSINGVLKQHEMGKVMWLYKVDDIDLQKNYKFPRELLPEVEFEFFCEGQRPPRHVQVRVGSLHTLSEQHRVRLTRPCYRNIVHWVQLTIPSVLPNGVNYLDESRMGVGTLLASVGKSGEVEFMSTVGGLKGQDAADFRNGILPQNILTCDLPEVLEAPTPNPPPENGSLIGRFKSLVQDLSSSTQSLFQQDRFI